MATARTYDIFDTNPTNLSPQQNAQAQQLPSLHELDLVPEKSNVPISYGTRRRGSLAFTVQDDDDEEYEEPAVDSPIMWRRTSLDAGLAPRLRHQPKIKEENEMEYVPERRTMRKRSFSEEVEGDDSDSEEEKPRKYKAKKCYKGRKGRGKQFECAGKDNCLLCKHGSPYYLQKSMNPGWRETLLAVFEYFPKRVTFKDWITTQSKPNEGEISGDEDMANKEHVANIEWLFLPDAYAFLEYHWDILCPPQHKNRAFSGTNWRKTLQDTLSHNRTYFISGKELFGKTGFWRLSDNVPVQNGLYDNKALGDLKYKQKQANSTQPSMYTIDAILKRAEEQGQIPVFTPPTPVAEAEEEPCSPAQLSELEILITAIEKMHSSCS